MGSEPLARERPNRRNDQTRSPSGERRVRMLWRRGGPQNLAEPAGRMSGDGVHAVVFEVWEQRAAKAPYRSRVSFCISSSLRVYPTLEDRRETSETAIFIVLV